MKRLAPLLAWMILILAPLAAHAAPLTPPQLPAQSAASDNDLLVIWPVATNGPLHNLPFTSMIADVETRLNNVYTRPAGAVTPGNCVQWTASYQIGDAGLGCGTSSAITWSAIPTQTIGANHTLIVSGINTNGDNGAGCVFTSTGATAGGPMAKQDAGGTWFNLALNGKIQAGCYGAYGDAHFAFFTGSVTTGPCTLSAFGITGTLLPGDTLRGDGVTGTPTLVALLSGSTTGPSATFSLSSCNAIAIPSLTASLAPATATTSTLTVTGVGANVKLTQNMTITGPGVATNTQIISGPGAGGAGTYTVSQGGQTVGSEAMAAKNNLQTWGGHDDTAAIQAAVATGMDVTLNGPLAAGGTQINYFGITAPVTLPAKRQKFDQASARMLALPSFAGDYMLVSGASRQHFGRIYLDGGGVIGAQNVGGFQCAANTSDSFVDAMEIIHHSTIGIDVESSCRLPQASVQQWNNGEPWLNQWMLSAIGKYYNHADSQENGGYANWNGTNYYFDCNAHTEMVSQIHPFTGNPTGGNGGAAFVDPENIHIAGCAGGEINFDGMYDDNGQINNFDQAVSLRNLWPLVTAPVTTYTNSCYINEYPNGQGGQPNQQDLRIYETGQVSGGLAFVCLSDNPNTVAITGVTGDGSTATATLGPTPSVPGVSVAGDGTNVRYRVANWPAGHPLSGPTFSASVSGTTLTVDTATITGPVPIAIGQGLVGAGVPGGTTITAGSAGSWTISAPLTIASENMQTGDQFTTSGYSTGGFNGTFTVIAANPFYITAPNTTTGATSTGTIQPLSAWTSDNPMPFPLSGGTSGFINIAGVAGSIAVSSGVYTPATGDVALTLASPHGIVASKRVSVLSATGTGSFASINGVQVATAGTTGSTIHFTIATGLTMTITGGSVGYNAGRVRVTAVGANSISYLNGFAPTETAGGTVQEAYAGDWSGVPALEPNFSNLSIETGSRLILCQQTNIPCWQEYSSLADTTGGLGHTYQIGGSSGLFTQSFTNTGWKSGAVSGASTYCLGLEANPACLVEDGSQDLFVYGAGVCRWEFLSTGALLPCAAGSGTRSVGTAASPVAGVFTSAVSLANLLFNSTAPTISSGFGSSPSIVSNNGAATFRFNVGTGGSATGGVLGMPTANAGWNCVFKYLDPAGHSAVGLSTEQTASTVSSVSVSNYTVSSAALTAWPTGSTIVAQCEAY